MTNLTMIVTQAAAQFIKKNVEKEQGVGFRLSVKKTGCSGYSYVPTVVTTVNEHDTTYLTDNGVTIFVDTAYLDMLQNITIDYIEEEKTGLKQKRLVFTNPHESSRCGCGESFQVD